MGRVGRVVRTDIQIGGNRSTQSSDENAQPVNTTVHNSKAGRCSSIPGEYRRAQPTNGKKHEPAETPNACSMSKLFMTASTFFSEVVSRSTCPVNIMRVGSGADNTELFNAAQPAKQDGSVQ